MNYVAVPNLHAETPIPEKGTHSHTLFSDDHLKIILFGFAPGAELKAHTAPMPVTIMILEGEATLTLGEDHMDAVPGTLVHMPPQLSHGIQAKTPLRMLLYMHKSAKI